MSNINYQFSPVPQSIKDKMSFVFKGNKFIVLDRIANEVFLFPENRDTLTKRLSLRFIAQKHNMDFSNVRKIIRSLAKMGVIEVLEKGRRKLGSLIRICIDKIEELYLKAKGLLEVNDTTKETSAPVEATGQLQVEDTTKKEGLGVNHTTISGNSGVEDTTKQKLSLKTNKTNNQEQFVSSSTENTIKNTIKPQEIKLENKNLSPAVKVDNNFIGPAEMSTIVKGISKKVLPMGIQELKNRGITEINIALQEIENEMVLRGKIKYPENYFISLCQKKNNWQNIVKKTETDKETRQEMKERQKQEIKDREKEEEERIAIIEENLQYNEIAKDLQEKFPAEFKAAFKEVEMELRKKKIFDCIPSFVKNQYAIEVFKVMFSERI